MSHWPDRRLLTAELSPINTSEWPLLSPHHLITSVLEKATLDIACVMACTRCSRPPCLQVMHPPTCMRTGPFSSRY